MSGNFNGGHMQARQASGIFALIFIFSAGSTVINSAVAQATKPASASSAATQIERGRYLLNVGSCNDCHTAGFAPSDGKVPEKEWLLGSGPLGFRGPWGTTYAPNLRLTLSKLTEDGWVNYAKALKTRPPMPWFNLNRWSDSDLRAFYQYVKQLGPVGAGTQAYLPADKNPKPPYIQWPAAPK